MEYHHCENYNIIATDKDGDLHYLHANQLAEADLHYWKNWTCNAGYDYIYVNDNGDIWAGTCLNHFLGNIYKEARLLETPGTCHRDQCTTCTTDLMVKKIPPSF